MARTTAVSYANCGAGRVPLLAMLARGIKELESSSRCTAAALRIAGKDNSAADALPRVSVCLRGQGPRPGRGLRAKFRKDVEKRRGPMNVDMVANGKGTNA